MQPKTDEIFAGKGIPVHDGGGSYIRCRRIQLKSSLISTYKRMGCPTVTNGAKNRMIADTWLSRERLSVAEACHKPKKESNVGTNVRYYMIERFRCAIFLQLFLPFEIYNLSLSYTSIRYSDMRQAAFQKLYYINFSLIRMRIRSLFSLPRSIRGKYAWDCPLSSS